MSLVITFIIFAISMAISLNFGITMIVPLLIGFVLFVILGVLKGFALSEVLKFSLKELKDSFIVIGILLLIGCLTGLWRACGTVAYFVTLGVSVIPKALFLLAAFLLTSVMSFALGTSYGVTATAGVILISIARAGGVNPILAAGAIYSGVYVGDRGSPAASSGNLVAVLTHTDMRENVAAMFKSALLPFVLCCMIYGAMSFFAPIREIDTGILNMLSEQFHLVAWCLIPAILMILLPFLKVSIRLSMVISIIAALLVCLLTQDLSLMDALKAMVLGFHPEDAALSEMLSGGGIVSMLEVAVILLVSGTYSGIFRGTKMLEGFNAGISGAAKKIGRFPVMIFLAIFNSSVLCNQTIAAIMQNQLTGELYTEEEKKEKMLDMENSVILIAGLVPWCIACSVPLAMLDVGPAVVPLGFYLWLVPIFHLFRRMKEYKKEKTK